MKYNIIYADPPWNYNDPCNSGKRGAIHKYPTMSIEEIKKLPVRKIAADDSLLFLWVTFPLLQEGLDTIAAWGFKYKTIAFNWIKQSKTGQSLHWGMGNWTRANSEICLLGVRGNPKRVSAGVHSVVMSPLRKHSQKPDEVRDRIVELAGDLPRIELFARNETEGWHVWGNEVESDILFKGVDV